MNIHLQAPTRFTISDFEDEELNIQTDSPALYFSALTMWVAALARCTYAVLEVYGHRFGTDSQSVQITMEWEYAEQPTRFRKIVMDIHWPTLPEKRRRAVERAAQHCTIHNTIHDCVEIVTTVRVGDQQPPGE